MWVWFWGSSLTLKILASVSPALFCRRNRGRFCQHHHLLLLLLLQPVLQRLKMAGKRSSIWTSKWKKKTHLSLSLSLSLIFSLYVLFIYLFVVVLCNLKLAKLRFLEDIKMASHEDVVSVLSLSSSHTLVRDQVIISSPKSIYFFSPLIRGIFVFSTCKKEH